MGGGKLLNPEVNSLQNHWVCTRNGKANTPVTRSVLILISGQTRATKNHPSSFIRILLRDYLNQVTIAAYLLCTEKLTAWQTPNCHHARAPEG
jgi:hypothetical protein